eukprot:52577_1
MTFFRLISFFAVLLHVSIKGAPVNISPVNSIIKDYTDLSSTIQKVLQQIVSQGNDTLFTTVITDIGLNMNQEQVLWDFIKIENKITSSTSAVGTSGAFIGDYKLSALSEDHGNWLLCNGAILSIQDYPLLFSTVGYSFGGLEYNFYLPNPTNNILGVEGDTYNMGEFIGNEKNNVAITVDNLPAHGHALNSAIVYQSANQLYAFVGGGGMIFGHVSGDVSANTGNNVPVEVPVIQPTLFIGNLFIYGDPQ